MADDSTSQGICFGGNTPILRVTDAQASMDYYTRVLGFRNDWGIANGFASITRDGCHIFFSEGDQGHVGSWIYIGVNDVDALYEELKAKGAKIRHPPTNYDWACEMQVEDLDGNVLRIGSERKPGEANGEWLDMQGHRWIQAEDHSWREVKGE